MDKICFDDNSQGPKTFRLIMNEKCFEGEMLIRTLPTTFLQIFHKIILNSKSLPKVSYIQMAHKDFSFPVIQDSCQNFTLDSNQLLLFSSHKDRGF